MTASAQGATVAFLACAKFTAERLLGFHQALAGGMGTLADAICCHDVFTLRRSRSFFSHTAPSKTQAWTSAFDSRMRLDKRTLALSSVARREPLSPLPARLMK
jgi:hypothetical protein